MKKYIHLLAAAFLVLTCAYHSHAQGIITTIAGIGTQSYSGDDSAAVNAGLDGPYAVALDGMGNYYIADGYNNRIRKVNAAGIITTIAGTGVGGYNGDGILATEAQIDHPNGMVFDNAGNLIFADPYNNRIRKIDIITGVISTIAGNGVAGYNGDGIAADTAELNDPHGVAIDATGNLYITDFNNHRIRKVNTSGIITTIAGTGISGSMGDLGAATDAEINSPYGIVTDNSGNIYFADVFENVVRKIDATGIITRFAGTGTASGAFGDDEAADTARVVQPAGLAIDANGNLYIAEIFDARVRKVTAATNIITTVAGDGTIGYFGDNGLAISAELAEPAGVAVDAVGNLFIADFANNRIRFVAATDRVKNLNAPDDSFNLYPNPSNGTFTLNAIMQAQDQMKIVITNMLGQTVKECSMPVVAGANTFFIQLNEPTGVYILSAGANSKRWSEKVIVRK